MWHWDLSSRQGVIVSNLDFRRGDTIVFVDNGQCVQLQEAEEGPLELFVAVGVLNILQGEQNLGDIVVVAGEALVVDIHELTLAHGCGGLLRGQVAGAAGQAQLADPHADGTRGDKDDLMAGVLQVAEDPDQVLHMPDVQTAGGMRQCGSADLDNDSHFLAPNSFVFS